MRPMVTVNCAMTADGKIAGRSRKQLRISSAEDLERVKRMRASSDAILVGVGTVLADDPHLTVKGLPPERNPLRVVLDSNGRTPAGARVLDARARTLIVTVEGCTATWPGADVLRAGRGKVDIAAMLESLYDRGVRTLMVEGGGETIFSFFESGMVDRYCVFVGSMIVGGRNSPTPADGAGLPEESAARLKLVGCDRLGDGVLLTYEAGDGPT
ncbi:MAG: 2,5-diamino-6-(ribosylamino)-4(3H)-pyrimidinone 5'-phosphate reductase [Methanomassiliicoccus sp.]|nr:2,5-diamino-6-(ribosylamino)-4(3H)-pyrimidinone 5'-phosphate reductase [Methanomassiliicoccus sp.]